jgi:hypothetical protein
LLPGRVVHNSRGIIRISNTLVSVSVLVLVLGIAIPGDTYCCLGDPPRGGEYRALKPIDLISEMRFTRPLEEILNPYKISGLHLDFSD